jgi:hypothetical protein
MSGEATYLLSNSSYEAPTTLDPQAFQFTFYNCDNLITAPELSATTVSSRSYEGMF